MRWGGQLTPAIRFSIKVRLIRKHFFIGILIAMKFSKSDFDEKNKIKVCRKCFHQSPVAKR